MFREMFSGKVPCLSARDKNFPKRLLTSNASFFNISNAVRGDAQADQRAERLNNARASGRNPGGFLLLRLALVARSALWGFAFITTALAVGT